MRWYSSCNRTNSCNQSWKGRKWFELVRDWEGQKCSDCWLWNKFQTCCTQTFCHSVCFNYERLTGCFLSALTLAKLVFFYAQLKNCDHLLHLFRAVLMIPLLLLRRCYKVKPALFVSSAMSIFASNMFCVVTDMTESTVATCVWICNIKLNCYWTFWCLSLLCAALSDILIYPDCVVTSPRGVSERCY